VKISSLVYLGLSALSVILGFGNVKFLALGIFVAVLLEITERIVDWRSQPESNRTHSESGGE
jgi:hypothetical protein